MLYEIGGNKINLPEDIQTVCLAIVEHAERGDAVRGQGICPPVLLAVVVCFGISKSVALSAQLASHTKRDEIARYVVA